MGDRGIPLTGIAALIVLIFAAIMYTAAPLDVRRPAEPPLDELQKVNARLWEDPFAAVARMPAGHGDIGLDDLCSSLRPRLEKTGRLLVLGVMMSSAPYADNGERRRRTRFAVQSALNVAHFIPETAERLGRLQWPGPTAAKTERLGLPFELARRKNASALGVDLIALVLWLEEEAFAGAASPVKDIGQLAGAIRDACNLKETEQIRDRRFEFAVIGPAQSSTLRAMIREVEGRGNPPGSNALQPGRAQPVSTPFSIYSPFSTASEVEMLEKSRTKLDPAPPHPCAKQAVPGDGSSRRDQSCTVRAYLEDAKIDFQRVTATDDDLAAALLEELARRGVDIHGEATTGRHHVALVHEWDTYYGRSLPKAFVRAANLESDCETDRSELNPRHPREGKECRFLRFSYLRGLDGVVPGAGAVSSPSDDAKKAGTSRRERGTERAEGGQQYDYLRRLAEHIKAQNDHLRENGLGEIGAIGVLGSDLYDKLAVLRALRPSFPNALFFTTDLDARLWHPEEQDFTRNLLVASSFGLGLAPCLQKHIPPFRSSYQTAAYFGTRVALYNAFAFAAPFRDDACPEQPDAKPAAVRTASSNQRLVDASKGVDVVSESKVNEWLGAVRLYELGRTRPVDLSLPAGDCRSLADCTSIHPRGTDRTTKGWMQAWAVFAAILVVLALFPSMRTILGAPVRVFFATTRKHPRASCGVLSGVLLAIAAIVVAVLVVEGTVSIHSAGGEPFQWIEGVSIWPSELIRALGVILGVAFLIHIFLQLELNKDAIDDTYAIEDVEDGRGWFARVSGRINAISSAGVWKQYNESIHWAATLQRALVYTALFYLAALVLFWQLGFPNRPARGSLALQLDGGITGVVVIIFLVLLFCVNDLTRRCAQFLDAVARLHGPLEWGKAANQRAAARLGVNTYDLPELSRALDPWLDVQIMAARTDAIARFIYYPFVLLGLLILARWSVFDAWSIPPALAAVLITSFAIACGNAFLMQRAAVSARDQSIEHLQMCLLVAKGKDYQGALTAGQIESLMAQVKAERRGAFKPFVEQPLVRAALIPFGSAGGLYLVELFGLASS